MHAEKLKDSIHKDWRFSVAWNLLLLTAGSALIAVAVKAVAEPFGLLTGGMSGLALLFYYIFPALDTGTWYFLLNVPVFLIGLIFVSRRFFLYSLYGMLATSACIELVDFTLPITDPWLAVFTCGAVLGVGVGVTLRSLGSTGGSDIIAILLHSKLNISIGSFEFVFNTSVLVAGLAYLDLDVMLYSTAMTVVTAYAIEYSLALFQERKLVLVVSERPRDILPGILDTLDRGATILKGYGAYTGTDKEVILTMVDNLQLKRLEEFIYTVDPGAFTIMGSGFHVLGNRFSRRKVY